MSIKLWLDDQSPEERPAIACPPGWVQVFTAGECIERLEEGEVEALSLDCDLGAGGTGYHVAQWLELHAHVDRWDVIPAVLECHSANPVERRKVLAAFKKIEKLREPTQFVRDVFGVPKAQVSFREGEDGTKGRTLRIEVASKSQSFDLKFSDLVKLTDYYGCTECDTRAWKTDGCETCDYGAIYYLELTFWKFESGSSS